MGKVIVWNCTNSNEDYSAEDNNFYIGRSSKEKSPLSNPFTFNGKRSNLAKMSFRTREEALKAYELYFDEMYGNDEEFTKAFDEIYEHYSKGEDVYLQCFCKPLPCHGDIIARKLQQKLIKERLATVDKLAENRNSNAIFT